MSPTAIRCVISNVAQVWSKRGEPGELPTHTHTHVHKHEREEEERVE